LLQSSENYWAKSVETFPQVSRLDLILFDIKGIVHKEFIMAVKKVNSASTMKFYGYCMKMFEDFALNFGNKRTDCCITTMNCLRLPFSPENFLTINNDCCSPPTVFFSVAPIEDKTERPPF
jgi:hypothetical protein